jgi:hypothetical protein
MATTFGQKTPVVGNTQGSAGQSIVNNIQTPQANLSNNGTRIEPKDSYSFVLGSVATFKAIFNDNDKPILVRAGTQPYITIKQNGQIITDNIYGNLVTGQAFEYEFQWEVPNNIDPSSVFYVEYYGYLNTVLYNFGNEYFRISPSPSNIKLKEPAYATVDQVRKDKFNIDTYLPIDVRNDQIAKDALIHHHLVTASDYLNGQLNLRDFHSVYNKNFNLFTRYYAIWSIMSQAMGEDGNAVSEKSLSAQESKWKAVLKQIKMHSQLSSIPYGRG